MVPRWLKDSAKLVNEAITAKYAASKFAGAAFAIQASIGNMAICPSGNSKAVSDRAMKRASSTPPVRGAVHSCRP